MSDQVFITVPPLWFDNYLSHVEYSSTHDPYTFIDECLRLMGYYIKLKHNLKYDSLEDTETEELLKCQWNKLKRFYLEDYSYSVEIHYHYYDRLLDFLKSSFDCIGRMINNVYCYLNDQGQLTGLVID